jgi:hypothetical protein
VGGWWVEIFTMSSFSFVWWRRWRCEALLNRKKQLIVGCDLWPARW